MQICELNAWTGHQEWDKYPAEQTSSPISLLAGERYFLEARLKEGSGDDHIEVAWTGPGIGIITVIAPQFLAPFDSNIAPIISALDSTADLTATPPLGQIVATFTASDSPFENLTYAIVSGDADQSFFLDPKTGVLTVSNPGSMHGGPYVLHLAAQDSGHGGFFPLRTGTTSLTVYLDDSDHDKLPDPWELAQFGDLSQSGSGDNDGDAISNRAEFLFGSDPSDDQSLPRPLALGSSTSTTAQFQFRVRKDAPSNAYALSWSEDYQSWTSLSPAEVTTIAVTPDGGIHHLLTIEIPAPGSHCFLRLGVD